MNKRKILVISGSRAEYGILRPLIRKFDSEKLFEVTVLATGLHLLESHGSSIREIIKDGFKNIVVDFYDTKISHASSFGKGLINCYEAYNKVNPEMILLLGDRLEIMASTIAASIKGIPIVHLHGGDKTDSGHIDESFRHSITRFANLHLTATMDSYNRLFKMGEEKWRIFNVGALGLDSVLEFTNVKDDSRLPPLKKEFIVCLFHPVSIDSDNSYLYMKNLMEALKEIDMPTVIIFPNNDEGSEGIIKAINQDAPKNAIIYKNLEHKLFIQLLKKASLLVGNSSSGIIESAILKLPVVNVGSRNTGRIHSENVLFSDNSKESILNKMIFALNDGEYKISLSNLEMPYGDGNAAEKIYKIISDNDFNEPKWLHKIITY